MIQEVSFINEVLNKKKSDSNYAFVASSFYSLVNFSIIFLCSGNKENSLSLSPNS